MDTIFSTPGRRSFGDNGTLPQKDDYAGLVIAEYSVNEWREHVNYPCLGYLTNKGKGKDDAVTGLFLACQGFYPRDQPDLTVVRGLWFCKVKHIFRYLPKRLLTSAQIKVLNSLGQDHYLFVPSWKDTGAFALFEKSFRWLRDDDDFNDPDAEKIVGALTTINGLYSIELWDQNNLHDDLVWKLLDNEAAGWVKAGGSWPRPPLGLTELYDEDRWRVTVEGAFFSDKVRRYGIDPSHLIYGETICIDGEEKYIALRGPPGLENFVTGHQLLTAAEALEIDPSVRGGWLQGNEREVVLTDTILTAHVSCIVKDGALVVGRDAAQQHLRLEHSRSWRVINMLLVDGSLQPIRDPHTSTDAAYTIVEHVRSNFGNTTDNQELLANEVRLQCLPELTRGSLDRAYFEYPENLSTFIAMADGKERWAGGRTLTLELPISGAEHFGELFGELMRRGWPVPRLKMTKSGTLVQRSKNHGYMIPMFHNDSDDDGLRTNVLSYCMETKRLSGKLALAFFGTNLRFIRGAAPPPMPAELLDDAGYDVVTKTWVPRSGPDAVVFTHARARAHLIAGTPGCV